MWFICLIISISCIFLAALFSCAVNKSKLSRKHKIGLFKSLFAGVFIAAFFMFFPIHTVTAEATLLGGWRAFLLSVFNSMQVFAIGCEFNVVKESMMFCPDWLDVIYQVWAATLFVLAPIFTFGFVMSLFKNLSAYLKYILSFFKEVYVFSELNEKSLVLANDIKSKNQRVSIVFTDVFEENEESTYELIENAKKTWQYLF